MRFKAHLIASMLLLSGAATAGEWDGYLVQDFAGCILIELSDGSRLIPDDGGGGQPVGSPVHVTGDLDELCGSICGPNAGCIWNATTTFGWPVDLCGTLVQDEFGCTLVELPTGERYIPDDLGGQLVGSPVRVVGDLDPTCFSICGPNDGCISNATVTLGWPIDVCGTLVQDEFGCTLVELPTGERYVPDDLGGQLVGTPVRVVGDLDTTCFSVCGPNDGCIWNATTTLGWPIDVCGTLVQDEFGCTLVELPTGERYVPDDLGGQLVGTPVRVVGDLDTTCFSVCGPNDGCIWNATTTLGWPIDVCGTLVQDEFGCTLVELSSGERYVPDDGGAGLAIGTGVRVLGDLDTTCFSVCGPNDGCIWNATTIEGGCLVGTNHCTSNVNSTGSATLMSAQGSTSVADNDLTLGAEPVPNTTGMFYYGPNQIQLPFGDGFRCVGGGISRMGADVITGNKMVRPVDLTMPSNSGPPIVAGSTWSFQAWFREPQGSGSEFNLSDGLEIQFVQ